MVESKIPKDWGARATFTMHNVAEYRRMSNDPNHEGYLRLWFFAVANVRANGHLPLRQNVLRYALGEDVDGVRVPVSSDAVGGSIRIGKAKGLLDPASRALCLIPARRIVVQGKGDPDEPCPRCDRNKLPPVGYLRVVS